MKPATLCPSILTIRLRTLLLAMTAALSLVSLAAEPQDGGLFFQLSLPIERCQVPVDMYLEGKGRRLNDPQATSESAKAAKAAFTQMKTLIREGNSADGSVDVESEYLAMLHNAWSHLIDDAIPICELDTEGSKLLFFQVAHDGVKRTPSMKYRYRGQVLVILPPRQDPAASLISVSLDHGDPKPANTLGEGYAAYPVGDGGLALRFKATSVNVDLSEVDAAGQDPAMLFLHKMYETMKGKPAERIVDYYTEESADKYRKWLQGMSPDRLLSYRNTYLDGRRHLEYVIHANPIYLCRFKRSPLSSSLPEFVYLVKDQANHDAPIIATNFYSFSFIDDLIADLDAQWVHEHATSIHE